MRLTGPQFEQIKNALLDAFAEASLRQMVRARLGEVLSQIAGGSNDTEIVTNLIRWAESTDRVQELIDAAVAEIPTNTALQLLQHAAQSWRLVPPEGGAGDKVASSSLRLIVPQLDDISGRQHGELTDALVTAFGDKETLRRMVAVKLDQNLDAITGGSTLIDIAFRLVDWAKRSGYLRELVQGAVDTQPRNKNLRAFALSVGAREEVQPGPAPSKVAPRPTSVAGRYLFLAYSRKDSDMMQRLRSDLLEAGIETWIDQDDLEPGSPVWQRVVEDTIRQSHGVVVILSPDAKQSDWVNIEISLAQRIGRRIFPVLGRGDVDDAVPLALETTHRVDVRTDYADGVHNRLIPVLRKYLGPSQPGKPEPIRKDDAAPKAKPTPPIAVLTHVIAKPPIDIDWITIPAGEFLMGSDKQKDELALDNETPQHRLLLPAYRIARYAITNAQYQVFVKSTGRRAPEYWENGEIPADQENHPVVNVSWDDARAFCAWCSEAAGHTIRLPSEPEWEKAARGTDGRIWPWGNEAPSQDYCNFARNVGDTTPVGAYPKGASFFDVLDMAGNAWEWTVSLFRPYPYHRDDGREAQESGATRTLRGGSWGSRGQDVRCSVRVRYGPGGRYLVVGFRVVSPGL